MENIDNTPRTLKLDLSFCGKPPLTGKSASIPVIKLTDEDINRLKSTIYFDDIQVCHSEFLSSV